MTPIQTELVDRSSDGTGVKDRGSCSVNALSIVLDIPFLEAQMLWLTAGRKLHHGVRLKQVHDIQGLRFIPVIRSPKTVQRFCQMFPKGRFFVRRTHHMFAVVNGKVHDWRWQGPRVRITHAWRVERREK